MLNKKAIAAFAAGATLLSGMALAAPAFVSAPAFAAGDAAKARTLDDVNNDLKDAKQKLADANKAVEDAKAKSNKSTADKDAAFTDDAKKAVKEDGSAVDASKYTVNNGVVAAAAGNNDADKDKVVAAAKKYLDAKKTADADAAAVATAEGKVTPLLAEVNKYEEELKNRPETVSSGAKAEAAKIKGELPALKAKVDAAFPAYAAAYNASDKAGDAVKAANNAKTIFVAKTPEDQQGTKAYKNELKKYDLEIAKAKNAQAAATRKLNATSAVFNAAVKAYNDKLAEYGKQYAKLTDADKVGVDTVADLALDMNVTYNPEYSAGAGESGSGSEGQGGSGEGGSTVKVDYKAVVAFAVKYVKDAKSDPKTVKALAAALAKVTAAKKAKDAKALVAALKELKALVDPLMKKAPTKDTGKALESVFGSDVLYTKYKGLAVDLIKLGVTNIGAYDGLLNQLEFGLSRFGWDNVVKNFPEHGPHNNCDFLAWLRRHLTKAVKHYGHVEAAVKDIQAELNEDMKDAQARHDWDAVKVIDQKIALANGLREVAHHNLTRAKALLNSANDHARDLSCDTAAKEVRAAMDKEPNSPFKKSGQKHNDQKPNGQNGQKPNGGAAGHTLGKTGATVALVAVAASVLAGMGAALRKIRH